jgi:ribosomal protein S18 acetylase RimI-like enzyme
VQGIRDERGAGAIQNLGITPPHRGRGLGTGLLRRALAGFRQVGLQRATLEVTAQNSGALRLYHRLGFRTVKIVYKAAEVVYA